MSDRDDQRDDDVRGGTGAFSRERSDPVSECRSCQMEIVWLKTKAGKTMPVDASKEAVMRAEMGLLWESGVAGLVSHFETCPQAKSWSRK